MTQRKPEYERLSTRADRGEFELVEPLDYLILEQLPEQGTMFANLYQIGVTTKEITQKFGDKVPTSMIGGRMHALKEQGLIIKIKVMGMRSTAAAWQRTPRGDELLSKWKGQG